MDAICEAEVQGESVYKLMFEENKRMNRVQTVVCNFSTTDGTSNLSHTSTITYFRFSKWGSLNSIAMRIRVNARDI
jgi:hypothetical protein